MNQRMVTNPRGVSRKVLINSILLLLFLTAAIVLFFLLRENAPPLLSAMIDWVSRTPLAAVDLTTLLS